MSKHLLLTGATGLVGQYLMRDLLQSGIPVAVLVRPRLRDSAGKNQAGESAEDRIERIVSRWEDESGRRFPRPVCLEGDVNDPGLGLNGKQWDWVSKQCDRLLHCAASLTFNCEDRNRDPYRTNLGGTQRVLDFCRETGIGELHYVSTAYVCGTRQDTIYETDLSCGQGFRNDYERSKWEAENMVRSASFLKSLTVYRPAVVVGDSQTGYTSTYHGFYAYPHFVWVLSQHAECDANGKWELPIRLNLTGEEARNLVPVDWVSAVIAHLVQNPCHHGQTYHLTPIKRAKARDIYAAIATFFNFYGVSFVGPDSLPVSEQTEMERLFYEQVSTYASYWVSEPTFDCSHTLKAAPHLPCPELDAESMHRLMAFAIKDRWGKGARKASKAASMVHS